MPPTTQPTTQRTSVAETHTLVTLELETKGDFCRLRAFGMPLRGVRKLHEWRFTPRTLTAMLLNEIGATVDDLSVAAVLGGVGIQGQLAFELTAAVEQIQDSSGT